MGSKVDLENFPTSESALRMLDDVSTGFYDKSYVGKWLFQVMGLEYDDAFQLVEGLPKQFFPETATWGLKYHEMKWQLPIRENLGYEERRRLIYQQRDYRAPMTPYRMENFLSNSTGLDVHISDCHDPGKIGFSPEHPNIFRVDLVGGGSQDAIIKVVQLLKEIKQSHTAYEMYHSLNGGMADVKVLAGGGMGTSLKVKAKTADKIEAKETLHVMTDIAVGGVVKVKPKLAKEVQEHGGTNAFVGILVGNSMAVKGGI